MWKTALAGTAIALIAGSSLSFAESMSDRDDGAHWRPSVEDIGVLTDARITALKAGLKLTPEQEKGWPPFEAAIRDMSKARADRLAARDNEQPPADPVERLRQRADTLGTVAANLKKLADAEGPFYNSLDDGQKHRFGILTRALRPHHRMHFAGWKGGGWFGHGGRGQDHEPAGGWREHSEQDRPNSNL